MSIVFHHAPMSSSTRVHWALEELGLPYEKVRVDLAAGEQRRPEFLALNPHGKVPVLVVDGTPMFESLAMLLFLGERFGVARNLWFAHDHADYPAALAWTVWGTVTFNATVFRFLTNTSERFPKDQQNAAAAEQARADLRTQLAALDAQLAGRDYLFAERFTLVALSLASFVGFAGRTGAAVITDFSNVAAWHARCAARPDYAVAQRG